MRLPIGVSFLLFLLTSGCGVTPLTYSERTLNDLYPILSKKEKNELRALTDSAAVDRFVDYFWGKEEAIVCDLRIPLRSEYESRVEYANKHFPDRWGRSDRKRIYLLYGPPSFIEHREASNIAFGGPVAAKSLEVWLYMTGAKHNGLPSTLDGSYPGEMRFIFGDMNGAGDVQLLFSSEDSQDNDARVYRRP